MAREELRESALRVDSLTAQLASLQKEVCITTVTPFLTFTYSVFYLLLGHLLTVSGGISVGINTLCCCDCHEAEILF